MFNTSLLWPLLIGCGLVAVASWAATGAVLRALVRLRVFDQPNERSSHDQAKPRGGGLAILPVLLIAWILALIWLDLPPGFWSVVVGAVWLAAVSWFDDRKGLSPGPRFLAQILAVGLGLWAIRDTGLVFQGLLPPIADLLLAGLIWLWFVNLFNFMDGIDGISGVESVSLGLGLGLVAWLAGLSGALIALPWLIAAAAAGFLVWNWEPAKLFLGDVGSVPLGYLLGWLLLLAAAKGEWAAALILPAYYLTDATTTLLRRALRGAKVWRAHREHFYQRAVRRGQTHAQVTVAIALCNAILVGFALVAVGWPWLALAAAALTVAALLAVLERRGRGRQEPVA